MTGKHSADALEGEPTASALRGDSAPVGRVNELLRSKPLGRHRAELVKSGDVDDVATVEGLTSTR